MFINNPDCIGLLQDTRDTTHFHEEANHHLISSSSSFLLLLFRRRQTDLSLSQHLISSHLLPNSRDSTSLDLGLDLGWKMKFSNLLIAACCVSAVSWAIVVCLVGGWDGIGSSAEGFPSFFLQEEPWACSMLFHGQKLRRIDQKPSA